MPQYYLRPIGDDSQFSDFSEYTEIPFNAPEGLEWIQGAPPDYATVYRKKTLADQLNDIFKAQSPEIRGAFGTLKAAVKVALDEGDTLAALVIINAAEVPEEFQAVKDSMLALFEGGS